MARNGKANYAKYEIKEILGISSPQETLQGNWVKAVLTSLMTQKEGGEEEPGIDIRHYNVESKLTRGGIRLSIQEAHNVCNILLQNGYGSLEVLEQELEKRKSMFSGKESR